jgi:hypothetical protein
VGELPHRKARRPERDEESVDDERRTVGARGIAADGTEHAPGELDVEAVADRHRPDDLRARDEGAE